MAAVLCFTCSAKQGATLMPDGSVHGCAHNVILPILQGIWSVCMVVQPDVVLIYIHKCDESWTTRC